MEKKPFSQLAESRKMPQEEWQGEFRPAGRRTGAVDPARAKIQPGHGLRLARTKVREILPFFADISLSGEILDVGSGCGAVSAGFLEHFPGLRATLMDLPEVLGYARELLREKGFHERFEYCPANILEHWPVKEKRFDLIILSNIVHAYSEVEISELLDRAAACLKKDGFLLIHDFFFEHYPEKAFLFDLNMFVNTFNGRVYPAKWLKEQLTRRKLYVTELLPLASDTALVIAGKSPESLQNLCLDLKSRSRGSTITFPPSGLRPSGAAP